MDSWPQPQVSGIGLLEAVGLRMCTQDKAQVMLLHTGFENTGLRWRFTTLSAHVNQREHNDEVRQDPEMLIPRAVQASAEGSSKPAWGGGGGWFLTSRRHWGCLLQLQLLEILSLWTWRGLGHLFLASTPGILISSSKSEKLWSRGSGGQQGSLRK